MTAFLCRLYFLERLGGRFDERDLLEAQLVRIVRIHFCQDAIAAAEGAFEHFLGEFVLDFALDGTTQRTRCATGAGSGWG